jgi:hypothetical protein
MLRDMTMLLRKDVKDGFQNRQAFVFKSKPTKVNLVAPGSSFLLAESVSRAEAAQPNGRSAMTLGNLPDQIRAGMSLFAPA